MAPQAIQVNRNDGRGIDATGDHIHAALEGLHVRCARDFAFRENADQLAIFELGASVAQRAQRFFGRVGRDGNRVEQTAEGIQPFVFVQRLPHQETNEARSGAADQNGVGIGGVIGNDERAALLGNVVRADDADFEEDIREDPQDQTNQRRGHQPRDVDRGGQRQHAQGGQDMRRRPTQKIVEQIRARRMQAPLRSYSRNCWWRASGPFLRARRVLAGRR